MIQVIKEEIAEHLLKRGMIEFNETKLDSLSPNFEELKNSQNETYLLGILMLLEPNFGGFLRDTKIFLENFFSSDEKMVEEAREIFEADIFENNSLYVVGGAVRDVILYITPKDIDFVTDVPFGEMREYFLNKGFSVKDVGKHFGVLMVKVDEYEFEIANFRKDIYEYADGKGADRVNIGTLEDDIQRRDFDVNCIYVNPKTLEIIDGNKTGLKSLYKKEFRFVGSPADRIKEDVIRLLRIAKVKKKGLTPTKETMKAFRNYFNVLCEFGNKERIREHIEELCF